MVRELQAGADRITRCKEVCSITDARHLKHEPPDRIGTSTTVSNQVSPGVVPILTLVLFKRIEEPEIPAVIVLDGASSLDSGPIMGGLMHLLGEVEPDKVHIGMKVKAVWKAPEEREGSVTDILYFKPIEN